MRDRDRLENELLELRAVADALDGSLRRLACGDIYQQVDAPFPRAFEGMRKDFNRGLASIALNIDEIVARSREIHGESTGLRRGLERAVEDGNRHASALSAGAVSLATVAETCRSQSIHADHISTILHNARLDIDRPRQAAALAERDLQQTGHSLASLKALVKDVQSLLREASLLALNGGISAAHSGTSGETALDTARRLHALTQQVGTTVEAISEAAEQSLQAATAAAGSISQLDREFDALNLYVEAAGSQIRTLGENAERGEALAEAIRTDLTTAGRREDAGEPAPQPPQLHLDAIDRAAAEIARQAGRFRPAPAFTPPLSPTPRPGAGSHLRLVKS